ncbi:hypothetical protein AV530_009244 [Patagioenas fasciata monilis]|uniref:CTXD1 protein n=1 Tax=Patagioenas fasciata monilis TaxID=372326 RepID=A0A1V4KMI9_PATFA|nr:hypothetical protein AV530_009244 [Patagioenas fasciata monilis]
MNPPPHPAGPSLSVTRMEDAAAGVDVDQGVAVAFVVLLGLLLVAATLRCARLVADPYSAVPTVTWEEQNG